MWVVGRAMYEGCEEPEGLHRIYVDTAFSRFRLTEDQRKLNED
jgi:hypothetical protein